MPAPPHEARSDHDSSDLARLGYAQELLRGMGGFSSFALSFSIISVLTGITTTYGVALSGAGPAALGIGWPIVSAGTLVVALAMGELATFRKTQQSVGRSSLMKSRRLRPEPYLSGS